MCVNCYFLLGDEPIKILLFILGQCNSMLYLLTYQAFKRKFVILGYLKLQIA